MEKRRGLNLVGLYEKLVEIVGRPKKPVPWGITAKEKGELRRHRKTVQASRRKNRG